MFFVCVLTASTTSIKNLKTFTVSSLLSDHNSDNDSTVTSRRSDVDLVAKMPGPDDAVHLGDDNMPELSDEETHSVTDEDVLAEFQERLNAALVRRRQWKSAITRHLGNLRKFIAEEDSVQVKRKLEEIKQSYERFEATHADYHRMLSTVEDIDESDAWYEVVEQAYIDGVTKARQWLKSLPAIGIEGNVTAENIQFDDVLDHSIAEHGDSQGARVEPPVGATAGKNTPNLSDQ